MADTIVQQPQTVSAQKHFTDLPAAETERSTFDRSHGYKTTFDAGFIYPFCVDEVVPGDTYNVNATMFVRLATPLKPIMDNVQCDVHWFFVPNRLVWDNWQAFMGERKSPSDDPTLLRIPEGEVDLSQISGKISDYFGLPLTTDPVTIRVNQLPYRGYRLIWNEWYRDQNLQEPAPVYTDDDDQTVTTHNVIRRAKRKDYLSSALPWPQKGDPVFLPLGVEAPILPDGTVAPTFRDNAGVLGALRQLGGAGNNAEFTNDAGDGSSAYWQNTGLLADLTTATAATINDIRTAFQIQKLLERDARGGTRYIEIILNHFNVQSPDFRQMRPEYLGGGTGTINVNPVASTVSTTDAPQANLSATGTGIIRGGFEHSFTEHGFIFGLISARADLTYQNGVERQWLRSTRYDYYWPSLAHLGEQPITNIEVFAQGTAEDDEVWGYQERYADYRYKPGRVTGRMRSTYPESLDVWHLAQDFGSLPPLNASFIEEKPPIDRVIAVPDEPHFICDGWISMNCTRPMPVYSVPGLVDHF